MILINWTNEFISRALDGLPKDKYRKRAQEELTDHLLALAADLESGGYCPEEAQARAVELMGAPDELNKAFRAEWVRKAQRLGYCVPLMLRTSMLTILFGTIINWFIIVPALVLFQSSHFGGACSDYTGVVLCSLHLIPTYIMGAKEFDRAFVLHPRRLLFTATGLLLTWCLEFLGFLLALFLLTSIPDGALRAFPILGIPVLLVCYGGFMLLPTAAVMLWSECLSIYLRLSLCICLLSILLLVLFHRSKHKIPPDKT